MKIIKRILIAIGLLVAAFSILSALVGGYINGYYGPSRIGLEKEYLGIALGQTRADVLFALGKPSFEKKQGDGSHMLAYWVRNDSTGAVAKMIFLDKDGRVLSVIMMANSPETGYLLEPLKWISSYANYEDVMRRLGSPDSTKVIDDGLTMAYRFRKHNLFLLYERKRLVALGIEGPEAGSSVPIFAWEAPAWEDLSPVPPAEANKKELENKK